MSMEARKRRALEEFRTAAGLSQSVDIEHFLAAVRETLLQARGEQPEDLGAQIARQLSTRELPSRLHGPGSMG